MRRKPKKQKQKKFIPQKYEYSDETGMRWRMVGMRPVSSLADSVMRDCGYPLP